MAQFKIDINTDNAAFEGENLGGELAFILREISNHCANRMSPKRYFTAPIRDTNGNTVGKFAFIK